jgi:hypothetical protein
MIEENSRGCGEIVHRDPSMWSPIEAAQGVKYKFDHISTKLWRVCLCTSLPEAFSTYSWEILQSSDYFHSVSLPHKMDECFIHLPEVQPSAWL